MQKTKSCTAPLYSLSHMIGIGVGTGANVLARYSVSRN